MDQTYLQRRISDWLIRETTSTAVRRVASVHGAVASEIGNVRSENQDKAVIAKFCRKPSQPYAIALVADGIGGMNDGAACAAMTIASFLSYVTESTRVGEYPSRSLLMQAAQFANETVHRAFRGRGGSTLVGALLMPGRPTQWVSAGDSRIYLKSPKSLDLLTVDDTIAGHLRKEGPVQREHAKLLQYIGMGRDFEPHLGEASASSPSQLILTTDVACPYRVVRFQS